jgi:hypothetical protein
MYWTAPDSRDWKHAHGGNYSPQNIQTLRANGTRLTLTEAPPQAPVPSAISGRIQGAHRAGHAWSAAEARYPTYPNGTWVLHVYDRGEHQPPTTWEGRAWAQASITSA